MDHSEQDFLAYSWGQRTTESELELTEAPQCDAQPSPNAITDDASIAHPATFSFPTLSPDGSIASLITPTRRHHQHTPPAALSSLGAKANMARHHEFEPVGSLADSDYDMLHDVSDGSNDDPETASLGSSNQHDSEDDGEPTPEGSVVDFPDDCEDARPRSTDASITYTSQETESDWEEAIGEATEATARDNKAKLENDLIDSYLSEDETPRQSTIRSISGRAAPVRPLRYSLTGSSPSKATSKATTTSLRILFCSERDVPDAAVERVCSQIVSCLSNSREQSSGCEVLRLPPTPTGINPTPSLAIRNGDVELTVQRCVGAEVRVLKPNSYSLHVLDADSKYTSIFTVGQDCKVDLDMPDFVVFYLDRTPDYPAWFTTVKKAMTQSNIPNMTIGGPGILFEDLRPSQKGLLDDSDVVLSNDDFFSDDNEELRADLDAVLRGKLHFQSEEKPPVRRYTRHNGKGVKMLIWKDLKKHILALLLIVGFFLLNRFYQDAPSPVVEMALRRDALSAAIMKMMNTTDTIKAFNVDHLIPHPASNFPEPNVLTSVHYQRVQPNHFLVSLLKGPGHRRFPEPVSTCVGDAEGRSVPFNVTKLIDGVYDVSIAPQEAYGQVNFKMFLKNPTVNFTVSQNYGKSFEKARLDFNKAINKNADAARQNAKSLKEKVGLELSAGAVATKNVTTQLALYAVRDLQVFANTAVSVLGKAAAASNETAARLRKDFVLVQKDLVKFTKDVQQYASSAAQRAKALIPTGKTVSSPLAISRERALGLKKLLSGRKKEANSTSASKELSLPLRLQNIFKPSEKSRKAGSLSDIARCVRAKDYKACRKEQKALSSSKTPSSLSTVPGENVFEQVFHELKPSSARDVKARKALESRKAAEKMAKRRDGEAEKAKKEGKRAARRRAREEDRAQRKHA